MKHMAQAFVSNSFVKARGQKAFISFSISMPGGDFQWLFSSS